MKRLNHFCSPFMALLLFLCAALPLCAQKPLTLVELNCENLFDTRHDSLKHDGEFTPAGARHWTPHRYWKKLDNVAKTLLASSAELPDLVALCEVENDTVLHDLTRRSLLRAAGYAYLMTESADLRGIDVALLYHPARFRPICYDCLSVPTQKGMRPTRDILYVEGRLQTGDTLHLFVVHAPSRYGGERPTRKHRLLVAQRLLQAVDSIGIGRHIVVAGDFNDYAESPSLQLLTGQQPKPSGQSRQGVSGQRLHNISWKARGSHGARATYRHQGQWKSIDHVLASPSVAARVDTVYVADPHFLLEADSRYGGVKPRRTFVGFRYQDGFSDHLPLVARFHR